MCPEGRLEPRLEFWNPRWNLEFIPGNSYWQDTAKGDSGQRAACRAACRFSYGRTVLGTPCPYITPVGRSPYVSCINPEYGTPKASLRVAPND